MFALTREYSGSEMDGSSDGSPGQTVGVPLSHRCHRAAERAKLRGQDS